MASCDVASSYLKALLAGGAVPVPGLERGVPYAGCGVREAVPVQREPARELGPAPGQPQLRRPEHAHLRYGGVEAQYHPNPCSLCTRERYPPPPRPTSTSSSTSSSSPSNVYLLLNPPPPPSTSPPPTSTSSSTTCSSSSTLACSSNVYPHMLHAASFAMLWTTTIVSCAEYVLQSLTRRVFLV